VGKILSHGKGWILGVTGLITLALGGTFVSPAVSGPSFLTAKKAHELFFTRDATKRYFLRKADGFTRAQTRARFLHAKATTLLQVSPATWVAAPGGTVSHSGMGSMLEATEPSGFAFFMAPLTVPATLQGRQVSIESFELCYRHTNNDPPSPLSLVALMVKREQTAANPYLDDVDAPISDNTDRLDTTCRTYEGPSPVKIGPRDVAQILLRVDVGGENDGIEVGRLTLKLRT
jgi:hypothetical protein